MQKNRTDTIAYKLVWLQDIEDDISINQAEFKTRNGANINGDTRAAILELCD